MADASDFEWVDVSQVEVTKGAGMTEWHTHRTLENADPTGRH
jgi:hypothetical protein